MIDPETRGKELLKQAYDKAVEEVAAAGIPADKREMVFSKLMLNVVGEIGKRDFFFFLDYIMGCKKTNRELHGGLCDFMMSKHTQKLILIPRGHLKSTICTVAYAIWRLMRNPNLRILISNYKLDNAKAFLHQIQQEFLNNEMLRACYGELIPDSKKTRWNESALTLKREVNTKEASIEVTGVGGEMTGRHYDIIIKDDLVGPENITTKEQIDKLRQWDQASKFILEPGGEEIYVGTRWHFDDLYGYIIENLTPPFQTFIRDIFKSDGSVVYPEKFTLEKVKAIELEMSKDPKQGRAMFEAQFRNRCIDEATAPFKRKFLTQYEAKDLPTSLGVSITVDPAISERESADFAAITVRGVDKENHWYVLETWQRRGVSPTELIDRIFIVYTRWRDRGYNIGGVGIEYVAYQKALQYLMRDEMYKRDIFMPLVDLGNSRTSKEYRIKALVPRWEQRGILLPKDAEGSTGDLLDQLFRFPKCVHDDLIDSLAMHDEIPVVAGATPEFKDDDPIINKRLDRYGYPVEENTGQAGFFL